MIATTVEDDHSYSSHKWHDGQAYDVILFYRYVNILDVEAIVFELKEVCNFQGLLGRILVAAEGINGTLAGSSSGIHNFVDRMKLDPRFCKVDWKFSNIEAGSSCLPFLSLSIRETKEIISSGRSKAFISDNTDYCNESFGGLSGSGEHLTPKDFHKVRINPSFTHLISNFYCCLQFNLKKSSKHKNVHLKSYKLSHLSIICTSRFLIIWKNKVALFLIFATSLNMILDTSIR